MSDPRNNKYNRVVRQYFPGGGDTLDLLNLVKKMADRSQSPDARAILDVIEPRLVEIANQMRRAAADVRQDARRALQ